MKAHTKIGKLATLRCSLLAGMLLASAAGCHNDDSTLDDPGVELRIRKNAKELDAAEKQDLVDAILALKSMPPPAGLEEIQIDGQPAILVPTYYDVFVAFHQAAVMQSMSQGFEIAHQNAAFLPWHRKLLWMYENALRQVSGKDITLPYWDWTDPQSTSAVFSADFMGPAGDPDCTPDCPYAVVEGPFRKGVWELALPTRMPSYVEQHPWTWIVRASGENEAWPYEVVLPTAQQVDTAMSIPNYDVAPYTPKAPRMMSLRNYVEGFDDQDDNVQYMHNVVHDWVAGSWKLAATGAMRVGTMEPLDISPSDPVFFLHHANVDRVWAMWQVAEDGRMDAYAPDGEGMMGWNRNDPMYQYQQVMNVPEVGPDITPGDMLDFQAMGFIYADLPVIDRRAR